MKYLSFDQLREKLGGRSRNAIYNDVAAGKLPPPVKLGKLYWPEADVEEALKALQKPHNSAA